MVKHALDKKTLKQDVIRDSMFDFIGHLHHHRVKYIILGVLALSMAAMGGGVYAYKQYSSKLQGERFYHAEKILVDSKLEEKKRLADGKQAFQDFLQEFPDALLSPVAWMKLARIAWDEKDLDGAEKAFQQAGEHSAATTSTRHQATIGLAKLKESRGEYDSSRELYQSLPDEPYADLKALGLGRIALAQNKGEEARKYLEQVAKKEPPTALSTWAEEILSLAP